MARYLQPRYRTGLPGLSGRHEQFGLCFPALSQQETRRAPHLHRAERQTNPTSQREGKRQPTRGETRCDAALRNDLLESSEGEFYASKSVAVSSISNRTCRQKCREPSRPRFIPAEQRMLQGQGRLARQASDIPRAPRAPRAPRILSARKDGL